MSQDDAEQAESEAREKFRRDQVARVQYAIAEATPRILAEARQMILARVNPRIPDDELQRIIEEVAPRVLAETTQRVLSALRTDQARRSILRIGRRRLGEAPAHMVAKLETMTSVEELESLKDSVLDCSSWDALWPS